MEGSEGQGDAHLSGVRGKDDGFIHISVIKRGSVFFFLLGIMPPDE